MVKPLRLRDVKLIPDGSGEITCKLGIASGGFGMRPWCHAAVINDDVVEQLCFSDDSESNPCRVSSPQNVLETSKTR